MIIGIWAAVCVCAVVILGEVKYRCLDQGEKVRKNRTVSQCWKENVDVDFGKLFIERPNTEFVSSQALAGRGSWRLTQDQVMGKEIFSILREEEYTKKL